MLPLLFVASWIAAALGGLGVVPVWPALVLALPGSVAIGWMGAPG